MLANLQLQRESARGKILRLSGNELCYLSVVPSGIRSRTTAIIGSVRDHCDESCCEALAPLRGLLASTAARSFRDAPDPRKAIRFDFPFGDVLLRLYGKLKSYVLGASETRPRLLTVLLASTLLTPVCRRFCGYNCKLSCKNSADF